MYLFEKVCVILLALQIAVRAQTTGKGDKVSEFLKKKFETYDRAVRPNFGGKPVTVTISSHVIDVFDINEKRQEFSVSLYLRHEWRDPRLEFTEQEAGTDKLTLNREYVEKIWRVDSFIVNERDSKVHDFITDNQYLRIKPDGTVLVSFRFTITAVCPMSLGWFPFDRHVCSLSLESYGHNADDVRYQWKFVDDPESTKKPVSIAPGAGPIQFSVAALKYTNSTVATSTAAYSRLEIQFYLARSSTRFVHQVYLPTIIIVLLAFLTLFPALGTAKSRLQMSILLEGLLIILMALSAETMPAVSYETALDFYLTASVITTAAVILANVAFSVVVKSSRASNGIVRLQSVSEGHEDEEDGKEVLFNTGSQFSTKTTGCLSILVKLRMLIPLAFAAFNLIYWMVILIGSSGYPDDFEKLGDLVL